MGLRSFLRSIREDKNKGWFFHIHHEILAEYSSDISERIEYIKQWKSYEERSLRLKLIRKAKVSDDAATYTAKDWEKLHREQCDPQCPWIASPYDNPLWGTIFTQMGEDKKWGMKPK